jgi:NAD(P)-dependent dehydrogenase (short-subunit alcohol dehydrogenase family)
MSGLRLDGRVAAVTGAGRGIGRAYALLLAQLGAKVVVNDLGGSTLGLGSDAGPADEVVKQVQAAGGTAVANYGDVATVDGGKSVVDAALQEFGGIDIVVNNAGNMVWGSLPEATIEMIEAHWAVHVRGSFNTLHAAWPHFLDNNYGRVVLTTSVGMFGLPGNIGYAIAKASMIGMAKSLTVGRGDANVNINCIAPNAVTRLGARTVQEKTVQEKTVQEKTVQEKTAREQAAQEAMPPVMDPALVAPMVAYLAHESCDVSGEVFVAGAGRFARLFVGVTPGYVHPGVTGVTVDDVAANWAAINDEAGYYVPSTLMDWAGHYMAHLGRQ